MENWKTFISEQEVKKPKSLQMTDSEWESKTTQEKEKIISSLAASDKASKNLQKARKNSLHSLDNTELENKYTGSKIVLDFQESPDPRKHIRAVYYLLKDLEKLSYFWSQYVYKYIKKIGFRELGTGAFQESQEVVFEPEDLDSMAELQKEKYENRISNDSYKYLLHTLIHEAAHLESFQINLEKKHNFSLKIAPNNSKGHWSSKEEEKFAKLRTISFIQNVFPNDEISDWDIKYLEIDHSDLDFDGRSTNKDVEITRELIKMGLNPNDYVPSPHGAKPLPQNIIKKFKIKIKK